MLRDDFIAMYPNIRFRKGSHYDLYVVPGQTVYTHTISEWMRSDEYMVFMNDGQLNIYRFDKE